VARSAILHSGLDGGPIRLAPGSHSSPREGVCVVELASMLGGEEFSDRPDCVCPVIAGFMRSFNDRASHAERQRLVPYAARAVGSRGDRRLTQERRDVCLVWAGALPGGGRWRWLWQRMRMRMRIWLVVGLRESIRLDEGAGEYAARVVFARHSTESAFWLLNRLLALGELGEPASNGSLEAAPLADSVHRSTQTRVAAAIRELAGDAQVAEDENGRKPRDHNGHAGHLGGRNSRNGHEEHVEDDRARNGDPEGETKPADDPHGLARVP
jgi:hypothetical protein